MITPQNSKSSYDNDPSTTSVDQLFKSLKPITRQQAKELLKQESREHVKQQEKEEREQQERAEYYDENDDEESIVSKYDEIELLNKLLESNLNITKLCMKIFNKD